MAYKFKCPACGFEIITKYLKKGEEAKCKECGIMAVVPNDAEEINGASTLLPESDNGLVEKPLDENIEAKVDNTTEDGTIEVETEAEKNKLRLKATTSESLTPIEEEILLLLRANYPLIYIVSWEEGRVEEAINRITDKIGKRLVVWSVTTGYADEEMPVIIPIKAIDEAIRSREKEVYLFKDMHSFFEDPLVIRKFRDFCREVVLSEKAAIIVAPILTVPRELEKEITIVDFPLPNHDEINAIIEKICLVTERNDDIAVKLDNPTNRERVIKAASGLTATEIENVFSKALVRDRCFSVEDIDLILTEKKQIIRKSGLLEYYENEDKMENVGGLSNLKEWVNKRSRAFTEEARDFGLPEPKGILILGVQGCGKSLCAKSISDSWRVPLLRLDMGAVFGKYIGESEQNIRRAIKTAESISPVVLWLDELEKGLAGTSGFEDTGTTARVFGTFLTWMQEKAKPVFVVATANDISRLPPELVRKGRFDEIFFVDLPNRTEREEIFRIHIGKRGRDGAAFDLVKLADLAERLSGAEIEQIVISGLYDAFEDNRDLTEEDLVLNIRKCVPLARTMAEQIQSLRNWAKDRALKASQEV